MNVFAFQAYTDFLADPQQYQHAFALMPSARQEKAAAFHLPSDQQLSVGAWLLLGHALKAQGFSLDPQRLSYGNAGKPALEGGPFFNLSHSGNSVMCVICAEYPVGCDVQQIIDYKPKLCRYCMQAQEQAEIEAAPASQQAQAFTRRWALKESYMKVDGQGLSRHPSSFAIAFDTQGTPTVVDGANNPTAKDVGGLAALKTRPTTPATAPPCSLFEYFLDDGLCYAACAASPTASFAPLTVVDLSSCPIC